MTNPVNHDGATTPPPDDRARADRLPDSTLAALEAILRLSAQRLPVTVQAVAEACGSKSNNAAWWHLKRLRRAGLVAWDRGARATIRPLVRFIPASDIP